MGGYSLQLATDCSVLYSQLLAAEIFEYTYLRVNQKWEASGFSDNDAILSGQLIIR